MASGITVAPCNDCAPSASILHQDIPRIRLIVFGSSSGHSNGGCCYRRHTPFDMCFYGAEQSGDVAGLLKPADIKSTDHLLTHHYALLILQDW